MSELLLTRKEFLAAQERHDPNKKRTAEDWKVVLAEKKANAIVQKAFGNIKKDMRILKSLQKWERESEQTGMTMLVLTPLDGKSPQLPVILGEDRNTTMSEVSNFFKKLNAIQEKYSGTGLTVAPNSRYQVDIYIAGENITMAHRAFAQVSRKSLENSTLFFNLACDLKDLHLPSGASYQALPELSEAEVKPLLLQLEAAAN